MVLDSYRPNDIVQKIGFPRSGNTFVDTILENILIDYNPDDNVTGRHGNDLVFWDFWEKNLLNKNGPIMVFNLRNYKECIISILKTIDYRNVDCNNIIDFLNKTEDVDYIRLLDIYDKYKGDKILIYYESLIDEKENKNLVKSIHDFFLKTEPTITRKKIPSFKEMKKIGFHNYTEVKKYGTNLSNSKKIYHSKMISKKDRIKIDQFLEKEYPQLFSKYLSHYKEKE